MGRPGGTVAPPRRELRIAMVLYGGVSLCIYMHGNTKETNRLVRASALLAAGASSGTTPTEIVYRELLESLAGRDGFRTDVSVDVIAGTSAGGINGVYLAKAVAHNLSQDALRDLWLKRGAIKELIGGWWRLPLLLLRLPWKAPLRGGKMAVWLHEALEQMDAKTEPKSAAGETPPAAAEAQGPGPGASLTTLMPPGGSLDLRVTMTDFYGYDRQVAIFDPKTVHDEQHRHVFQFRQDADHPGRFAAADNVALAFAARATSCFPSAFEPVSRSSFCGYLNRPPSAIDSSFFRIYTLSGADPDATFFIDGGVLDNRPFAPAIEAIREQPARVEVKRRLLYLDPDPAPPAGRARDKRPTTIAAVMAALSGLPRKQPILDSLLEVEQLNAHARLVGDVVRGSFNAVRGQVEALDGEALPVAAGVSPFELRQEQLHAAAPTQLGIGYAPYLRTKIATALTAIGQAVCELCQYPPGSNQAQLVEASLLWWGRDKGLFEQLLVPSQLQIAFLRDLDVQYELRRIYFTLAGVNWLYEPRLSADTSAKPNRDQLDAAKSRLWRAVEELEAAMSNALSDLRGVVRACFPEDEMTSFLNEHGVDKQLWLKGRLGPLDDLRAKLGEKLGPELATKARMLHDDLSELLGEDTEEARDVLVRFTGFPLWDAQLYPLESASGIGERDAIEVIRMSPLDSPLLYEALHGEPPPCAAAKLKGVKLAHFGAFFRRRWRENDYLMGRLDGAERLVSLLVKDEGERRRWTGLLALAILDEEQDALRTIKPLMTKLHRHASTMASAP
ncbi:MAG TPA: patatin-like protein [Solirubrobacteraceae bacterium]